MGLFSFFKKSDTVGKDSAIDSKELTGKKAGLSTKSEVTNKAFFPS